MRKGLVIFSGGQDSTTCLGWAINKYEKIECITFFYNQKHSIELEQAKKICEMYKVKQTLIDISFLTHLVDSALTSNGDVNKSHPRLKNLPASFVPNRNALFITLAHAYAQKIGAETLVGGMCETDFSGYPDCRNAFLLNLVRTLNDGSEADIMMSTPLMWMNKAQTFQLAKDVDFLETVIEHSHTCYNGDREHRHAWGYGCGECPACKLRKEGYEQFLKL
jgi:7-cyano-7-deazaguanine synthase